MNARQFKLNGSSTVTAGTLNTTGSIVSQQSGSTITADKLTGSLAATASFAGTNNDIAEIGDFATGTAGWSTGGFTLVDNTGVAITGALSSTGGDIDVYSNGAGWSESTSVSGSVTSEGGAITLSNNKGNVIVTNSGDVNATDGDVNFASNGSDIQLQGNSTVTGSTVDFTGGQVTQSSGSKITADALTGTVQKFAHFDGTANMIASIGDFATGTAGWYDDANGFRLVDTVDLEIAGALSTSGGDVDVDVDGDISTTTGTVNANGGDIDLSQTGIFINAGTDTVLTSGTGTINLYQNDGGNIQDAIDAVENTGSGLNTITVSEGLFNESLAVYEDNFLLKGANYGISGTSKRGAETVVDPNSPGVLISGDYVTVDGFTFTGGDSGVEIAGGDYAKIQNNRIYGNTDNGVLGYKGADHAEITDNLIAGGDYGVRFYGSDDLTIEDNFITRTDTGIHVGGRSYGVDIDNNDITDVNYGIYADNVSSLTITDNEIDGRDGRRGKGVTGIYVEDSNGAVIGGYGDTNYVEDFDTGISVSSARGVDVTYNNVTETGTAIQIAKGSYGADVIGNYIYDTDTGIRVKGLSNNAEILRNEIFEASTGVYVTYSAGTDIFGNDIDARTSKGSDYGDYGIRVEKSANIEIGNNGKGGANTIDDFDTGIYVEDSIGVEIDNNDITDGIYGIYADNVSSLNIEDNSIEGRQVYGRRAPTTVGIYVEDSYDARIGGYDDTNYVEGVDVGIQVNDSASADVEYNEIYDVETGILVDDSSYVDVKHNIVFGASENGIDVDDSRHAEIENNIIGFVGNDGIHVEDSYSVDVEENIVFFAGGDGIDVDGSGDAYIYKNGVAFVADNAIELDDSRFSTIEDNFIRFAGDNGISVSSSFVSITGNNVAYVVDDGIEVNGGFGVAITANTVDEAGDDGIDIDGGYGVAIIDNTIRRSGDDGIDVDGTTGVVVYDNTVRRSGDDGIYLDDVAFGLVAGNTVGRSGDEGIDVEDSEYVAITGNTVRRSRGDAIQISDTNNFSVNGNTIRIADSGVVIDDASSDGSVEGNNIARVERGVEVIDSSFITVDTNTITGTEIGVFVDPSSNITVVGNILDGNNIGISFLDVTDSTIESNVITNSISTGIQLENVDAVDVLFNEVTGSGDYGLFAAGPDNGSIVLSGNTFTDNTVSASFQSGDIDLTGDTNSFIGGDVALQFIPFEYKDGTFADLSLVGNTIGTSYFSGQSTYFVELGNEAFFAPGSPTILNGIDATYDTPFGLIQPRTDGIPIGAAEANFLEGRFYHFVDDGALGLFFFGQPDLDEEDFLKAFAAFLVDPAAVSVTMAGLPFVDPAQALNRLAPAAGGEGGTGANDLANIEPAAGGQESFCWGDAAASAGAGTTVNYSFGSDFTSAMNSAAGCQSGAL